MEKTNKQIIGFNSIGFTAKFIKIRGKNRKRERERERQRERELMMDKVKKKES